MASTSTNEKCSRDQVCKEPSCQGLGSVALAICGDPIVGRILVLLLRSSGYQARFLPASSLNELGALEGVRLLLLTPMPELNTKRRETLSVSLRDMTKATEMTVLDLVTPSEETREGGEARDESWHVVQWPCGIEELERRVEAALQTNRLSDDPGRDRDYGGSGADEL